MCVSAILLDSIGPQSSDQMLYLYVVASVFAENLYPHFGTMLQLLISARLCCSRRTRQSPKTLQDRDCPVRLRLT
jgi:hypothetical protein